MKISKDHSVAFSWSGIVAVAAFLIAWICASSIDTAWQFGADTLSEFGISDTDAKYYFNFGCMVTGVLVAVFGLGHAVYAKNAGHTVGGTFLALGGVCLALVGLITMDPDTLDLHRIVAVCMALFIFAGAIAITAGNWGADRKMFSGIGIVLMCLLTAVVFACDVAEIEAYGIIIIMIWTLVESVNMAVSCRKD